MSKVSGKRYAYRFDFHGLMAACQNQGQGGDPTSSAMISAATCYNKYPNFQHETPANVSSLYSNTQLAGNIGIAGSSSTNPHSTNLLNSNVKLPHHSTSTTNLPSTSSASTSSAHLGSTSSYWTYGQFESRPPHPPPPPPPSSSSSF